MATHKLSKGLDVPITGAPQQTILSEPKVTRVAVVATDYHGMKPRMEVHEGDTVKRGQVLFEDRKNPGVTFTAPGAGRVIGIHRGARRALQSVVIHLSESEQTGSPTDDELVRFELPSGKSPEAFTREEVRHLLIKAGLWTAFRTRPFSRVPAPDSVPNAIFVTASDTNPLAADPAVVIGAEKAAFELGLKLVAGLTDGPTFLCTMSGSGIGAGNAPVKHEEFSGPHPAGTAGVHIHTLYPVNRERVVWTIGYQDVIAVAKLAQTGVLDVTRVVAYSGPLVKQPRLVRTRLGAYLDDVIEREFDGKGDAVRVISGSVLSGDRAMGEIFGFLGRYHYQVTALAEGRGREFLGWLVPGAKRYSSIPIFVSKLFGKKKFDFDTGTQGSARAMVPIGMYERVMPLDILPTFLLRALVVEDLERAEELGALELDEEDLALCTFVCPGKTNYGMLLRKNLQTMQEEG